MKTSIDLIAPASAATAEREPLIEAVANALCCEHMGALPGAYSLTHENYCAKGSESAYMWKSARVAVEAIAAHVAAATAKERQARQLAEGENARLREALEKVFHYLGRQIKAKTLNESAKDGTQSLSLEVAQLLDGKKP